MLAVGAQRLSKLGMLERRMNLATTGGNVASRAVLEQLVEHTVLPLDAFNKVSQLCLASSPDVSPSLCDSTERRFVRGRQDLQDRPKATMGNPRRGQLCFDLAKFCSLANSSPLVIWAGRRSGGHSQIL
jgi:hypothetical protein